MMKADDQDRNYVMCQGNRFRLFMDEATIARRVEELGRQISEDYKDRKPILIGVLNGSFMFIADLMRAIDIECEVDFIKLSSYGAAKVSSGQVRELKKADAELGGRDIIVVEDIVDTGLSIRYMLDKLEEMGPASITVVTLLHKYEATIEEVQLDYIGFRIPNLFVIGYGLDYGQLGRNLGAIYILDEEQAEESGSDQGARGENFAVK